MCFIQSSPRETNIEDFGRKMTRSTKIIRIHHECEYGIEKSILRITDGYHEACLVMTKGDHEGWIFPSHPATNDGFFFMFITKYFITGGFQTKCSILHFQTFTAEHWTSQQFVMFKL